MDNFSFYKDGKALYCLISAAILSFSSLSARNSIRHSLFLQKHEVHGTITDGNAPLPGVTIAIKGSKTTASISDYTGQYSLAVAPNDTLTISFIGFKTIVVPVAGRSIINIALQYDSTTLQEVKVNAGYYSVKESERTGSIARITSKDIETQPVTNVLATMQGRMAGVFITQTTGVPGGGFDIKIRGQNSFRIGANNPLYIVDGVPYTADAIGSGSPSGVLPTSPSPLNSINPEQIESVEVLKDADATAIYGSRGANGVILITTKKGKVGKTTFSAKISTGAGVVTRFMNLMKTQEYLEMRQQAYLNDGIKTYPSSAYDINGTWDQNRYTDWQKELLGNTASISDYQVSLNAGSQQTQFLITGNYNHQGTVFIGDFRYKKAGVRINVIHESENKKFKINTSVGYTLQDNNQPQVDLMRETLKIAPNAPALFQSNGELNWEKNTFNNPLRNLTGKYKALTNDLLSSMSISYTIMKDLQLQANLGYTSLSNNELNTNPSTRFNPSLGRGPENSALTKGNIDRNSWIIEPQVSWTKNFKHDNLSFLAGCTFQSQNSDQIVQYGYGFTSNGLISNIASASSVTTLLNEEIVYRYQAFFARLNYNLRDKYILNITGRRDGSSRFGPGKQFANFGAGGLAWIFSKENLLKDNTVLSFGKIRTSYGITGSDQIGDYQYSNTYTVTGTQYGGVSGLQPSRLFNPDFGWESNKKFEVAIDLGFKNDQIFITGSYYDNRSSNQLAGISLPGTTGFNSVQSNLDATVQNKGLEFTLRTVNLQKKDWQWTTSLNLTFARTKLLEFPNLASSTFANSLVIGESLNIRKVYHFTGVDVQTGLYTFEDVNNDGVISPVEDKKTVLDLNPDYFGGLQNSLKYKNWQIDFLFQFAKQKNYNASSFFSVPGTMGNQLLSSTNSWKQPGDISQYQRYTTGSNNNAVLRNANYYDSDGAISDASYIRLKNISLSYDIPVKDFKCKLFFEGQNLLTFTKYNGADPEFTTLGFLPPLKIFSAGLQFNF